MRGSHSRWLRHRSIGFTLIELLVVISIMSLLIGILLPALGRARESAKATVDENSQRQIMIGMYAYGADNNGFASYRGSTAHDTLGKYDFQTNHIWGCWGDNEADYTALRNGPQPPTAASSDNLNSALGLGVLLPMGSGENGDTVDPPTNHSFGNYINIDILYTLNDREPERVSNGGTYAGWYRVRNFFGERWYEGTTWQKGGFPDPGGISGAWPAAWSGGNYYQECSYTWRGADFGYYDPSVDPNQMRGYQTTNAPGTASNQTGLNETNRATNRIRATFDHPDFANNYVLRTNKGLVRPEDDVYGTNVARGDGSVSYINNADVEANINVVTNWNSGFLWNRDHTKLFGLLDYYEGGN